MLLNIVDRLLVSDGTSSTDGLVSNLSLVRELSVRGSATEDADVRIRGLAIDACLLLTSGVDMFVFGAIRLTLLARGASVCAGN